jgi:aminomethyltransferase
MLAWTISKRRKEQFGWISDDLTRKHIKDGVTKKRVGFVGDKIPIRENTEIFSENG